MDKKITRMRRCAVAADICINIYPHRDFYSNADPKSAGIVWPDGIRPSPSVIEAITPVVKAFEAEHHKMTDKNLAILQVRVREVLHDLMYQDRLYVDGDDLVVLQDTGGRAN